MQLSVYCYKQIPHKQNRSVWNSINHQVKKSHASAAFLAVSLIEWTTLGLLAGFFISIIGGMSAITKLTVILCAGGYTGLIFGFFGGILYLYRTDSRHSPAESSPSATVRLSLKSKTAA